MTLADFLKRPGAVEHDGSACPVAGDLSVTILVRGGDVSKWAKANAVLWNYNSYVAETYEILPRDCQVIAYIPELPND
jgi:hypothetical protein